jgi:hypothetical protein
VAFRTQGGAFLTEEMKSGRNAYDLLLEEEI